MTSSVAKLFGGTALRGGSPKQRAWAEEIRAERLRGMSPEAAEMVCDPKGLLTRTCWWIDNRHRTAEEIAWFVNLQKGSLERARALKEAGDAAGYAAEAAYYNSLTAQFGFNGQPREGLVNRRNRR